MDQNLEIIAKAESDARWFEINCEQIRKTDVNRFVAVENGKIIARSERLEGVLEKLEEAGKSPSSILIRYVYEKGFKFVL